MQYSNNTEQASYQNIAFPTQQKTIIFGQVGMTRQNANYFPLMVGNHILGGLSLTSILFEQIRNQRGLVYSIQSAFVPLQYRGPFFIALQTRSNKATEALTLARAVLRDYIEKGPTTSQLSEAKQNLMGSFPLRIATNADIVANVVNIAFYHLPLNYLDTYRNRVSAVTATQIKEAFQQMIHPNNLTVVVVGQ